MKTLKKFYGYVYLTTNLINGKRYVGQHIKSKFYKNYYGSGKYLLRAIKKYNLKNFKIEILIWIEKNDKIIDFRNRKITIQQHLLDQQEIFYIKEKKSHISYLDNNGVSMGYNLEWGGRGGRPSKETKKKISKARLSFSKGKKIKIKNLNKITNENKSQEERDKTKKLQSQAHFLKTPMERILRYKKGIVTKKNRPQEEIVFQTNKTKKTWKNKSREDLNLHSSKVSLTKLKRTTEDKLSTKKRKALTMSLKSEEEIQASINKMKKTKANKTPEEKASIQKKKEITLSKKSKKAKQSTIDQRKITWKNKSQREKDKIKNQFQKTRSETSREVLIDRAKRGGRTAKENPKIICPYCGVLSTPGNFKRWHGDNCLNNPCLSQKDLFLLIKKRSLKGGRGKVYKKEPCKFCERIISVNKMKTHLKKFCKG